MTVADIALRARVAMTAAVPVPMTDVPAVAAATVAATAPMTDVPAVAAATVAATAPMTVAPAAAVMTVVPDVRTTGPVVASAVLRTTTVVGVPD
jgi:hypothetical protein